MSIETKFHLGDIVTFGYENRLETTCLLCEGNRRVIIKDKSYPCPECGGHGFVLTDSGSLIEGVVTVINAIQTESNTSVSYEVAFKWNGYDDKDTYLDRDLTLVKRKDEPNETT